MRPRIRWKDNINMYLEKMAFDDWEMDGTSSRLCTVTGFGMTLNLKVLLPEN